MKTRKRLQEGGNLCRRVLSSYIPRLLLLLFLVLVVVVVVVIVVVIIVVSEVVVIMLSLLSLFLVLVVVIVTLLLSFCCPTNSHQVINHQQGRCVKKTRMTRTNTAKSAQWQ